MYADIPVYGMGGSGGTFSTGNGGKAFIIATSGKSSTPAISDNDDTNAWSGVIFQGNEGKVYGSSYTLTANAEIPSGATLTIPENTFLTIGVGATLTNNGGIINKGNMTVMGTLTVNGTLTVPSGGVLTQMDGSISGTGAISGERAFWTHTLTEDIISLNTIPVYDGSADQSAAVRDALKTPSTTICGQEFKIMNSWALSSVTRKSALEYDVIYTNQYAAPPRDSHRDRQTGAVRHEPHGRVGGPQGPIRLHR